MKTTRLVDIAKRVGVSPTTVSRVINGSSIPRLEIKEKVMDAVREMNYMPNLMASNLAKGRFKERFKTKNIGFLVSGIPRGSFIDDGFYSRIFFGIEQVIKAKKHHLIFSSLELDSLNGILPSVIQDMKIDGALIEGVGGQDLVNRIAEHIPTVLVNYYLENVGASSVMPDNGQGIHKAVSYLYRLGHRKIAFCGLNPSSLHFHQRLEAYQKAVREMNLVDEDEKLEYQAGKVLEKLSRLQRPPTAIIFVNDEKALAFLKKAREQGIRVPEDISLIGFDDIAGASHSYPGLTTIRMPLEEMGRTAVNLLFESIEDSSFVIKNVVLNVKLVIRESCSSPHKSRFR